MIELFKSDKLELIVNENMGVLWLNGINCRLRICGIPKVHLLKLIEDGNGMIDITLMKDGTAVWG